MQKVQQVVGESVKHRKRRSSGPRMEKIGLAVPKETLEELQRAKDRRGMANVNELLRFYIGKCLLEDKKVFASAHQLHTNIVNNKKK